MSLSRSTSGCSLPSFDNGRCRLTHPASSAESPSPSPPISRTSLARGRWAGSWSKHAATTPARPCHSAPPSATALEGHGPLSTRSSRSQNSSRDPPSGSAYGYHPTAASASTMPRLHTSALNEYGSASSRSGDMYVTVPIHSVAGGPSSSPASPPAPTWTVPGGVQMPRSASLTWPEEVSRMLPGFTSRWMTSSTSCSISSALAMLRPTTASAPGESADDFFLPLSDRRMASSSDPPSMYSSTIWKEPRE
mmetsp:Transcript_48679/g.97431  ORF Transcript_48679/g.97431 Transcript_48679/m.97431 type:complete len:250 (+) Transcript_48679:144-893(+)